MRMTGNQSPKPRRPGCLTLKRTNMGSMGFSLSVFEGFLDRDIAFVELVEDVLAGRRRD